MPGVNETNRPPWAQQIHALRKRLKLSQQDFAARLGTTQSNVAKWEKGHYKPSPEHFMGLASLAEGEVESLNFMMQGGVPESFFMEKAPEGLIPIAIAEQKVREAQASRVAELAATGVLSVEGSTRLIPLLRDAAAAGTPRAVDDSQIERMVPVPKDWLPRGGTLYALHVKGDSMEPILCDGYVVIVDTDQFNPSHLVNEMVVARDDAGVTIKWLREDAGDYMLVANQVTPRFPIRVLRPGGLIIIGRVVKWIGEPSAHRRRTHR